VLIDHKHYIRKYGDDMPEITGWRWGSRRLPSSGRVRRLPGPFAVRASRRAARTITAR